MIWLNFEFKKTWTLKNTQYHMNDQWSKPKPKLRFKHIEKIAKPH